MHRFNNYREFTSPRLRRRMFWRNVRWALGDIAEVIGRVLTGLLALATFLAFTYLLFLS
jgi:hypothetical protein